jgi:hypothetical protein
MRKTPEYRAWVAAKNRCFDPKNTSYRYYGGRGITVDPVFVDSFEAFYAEVGPRPSPTHSLDRKDVNGNYAPGNLRWASVEEQLANRRPYLMNVVDRNVLLRKIARYEALYGPLPEPDVLVTLDCGCQTTHGRRCPRPWLPVTIPPADRQRATALLRETPAAGRDGMTRIAFLVRVMRVSPAYAQLLVAAYRKTEAHRKRARRRRARG